MHVRQSHEMIGRRCSGHQSNCTHSTVGSRAFTIAAAQLWNSLPGDVVLADSMSTFLRHLKHYLFQQCYPTLFCECSVSSVLLWHLQLSERPNLSRSKITDWLIYCFVYGQRGDNSRGPRVRHQLDSLSNCWSCNRHRHSRRCCTGCHTTRIGQQTP